MTTSKKKVPRKKGDPHLRFAWDANELSFVKNAGNRRKYLTHRSAETPSYVTPALSGVIERMRLLDPGTLKHIDVHVGRRLTKRDAEGEDKDLDDEAIAALKAAARTLAPYADILSAEDFTQMAAEIGVGESDGDSDTDTNQDTSDSGDDGADDSDAADGVETLDTLGEDMQKPEGITDAQHAAALAEAKKAYKAALAGSEPTSRSDKDPEDKGDEDGDEKKDADADKPADDGGEDKAGDEDKKKDDDDVAFSPAQMAAVQSMIKSGIAEATARSAGLEKDLKNLRDRALADEYTKQAERYQELGLPTDELSATLRSMHGNPKAQKAMTSILDQVKTQRSVAGARGGNLLGQVGSSRAVIAGSPEAQLEQLAQRLTERSDNTATYHQNYAKALRSPEGAALYEQLEG